MSLINPYVWPHPQLERMVYCTALRDREGDPSSLRDQQTYIAALRQHIPQLEIVSGKYVPRRKPGCSSRSLVPADRRGEFPRRARAGFPIGCPPRRSAGRKVPANCWCR